MHMHISYHTPPSFRHEKASIGPVAEMSSSGNVNEKLNTSPATSTFPPSISVCSALYSSPTKTEYSIFDIRLVCVIIYHCEMREGFGVMCEMWDIQVAFGIKGGM